jgi:hypothetical protein
MARRKKPSTAPLGRKQGIRLYSPPRAAEANHTGTVALRLVGTIGFTVLTALWEFIVVSQYEHHKFGIERLAYLNVITVWFLSIAIRSVLPLLREKQS